MDKACAQTIVDTIHAVEDDFGLPVLLVAFDTLAKGIACSAMRIRPRIRASPAPTSARPKTRSAPIFADGQRHPGEGRKPRRTLSRRPRRRGFRSGDQQRGRDQNRDDHQSQRPRPRDACSASSAASCTISGPTRTAIPSKSTSSTWRPRQPWQSRQPNGSPSPLRTSSKPSLRSAKPPPRNSPISFTAAPFKCSLRRCRSRRVPQSYPADRGDESQRADTKRTAWRNAMTQAGDQTNGVFGYREIDGVPYLWLTL